MTQDHNKPVQNSVNDTEHHLHKNNSAEMRVQVRKTLILFVIFGALGVFAEQREMPRVKRQSNPGDALVDAVFQIPIQTLTSVGTLLKATRPVIMQVRQRIQQTLASQPQRFSFPNSQRQQANDRISSVQGTSNYQRPGQNYQRPLYNPTSTYNRLQQQPSNHRFSSGKNKFFRDNN